MSNNTFLVNINLHVDKKCYASYILYLKIFEI